MDSDEDEGRIAAMIFTYCSDLKKKYVSCSRSSTQLYSRLPAWLNTELDFSEGRSQQPTPDDPIAGSSRGRPPRGFEEISERSKTRRVRHLVQQHSAKELSFATRMSLRSAGKRHAAAVVKEATETTPTRAAKMRKALRTSLSKRIETFSPEEALALIIDLKLSTHQYKLLRQRTKMKGINLYPAYDTIINAKNDCYPSRASITVTETSAEIRLQDLLDCTVVRLCQVQGEVLMLYMNDISLADIECIYKWGIDGSSGQSRYKQRFKDTAQDPSDAALLLTSIVPLQIYGLRKSTNEKVIIWQNRRASSTRYCRPIHIQFKKETPESTKEEVQHIEQQVRALQPTRVTAGDVEFYVKHKLIMTMVDGKVCNALTDTAAQVCYICGASPKQMNTLSQRQSRISDVTTYTFGLSPLHAHIRFFECLLHIAYRLEIKKWQVKNKADKEKFQLRKSQIIDRFRKEMGLLVDQPKPGGGTTNDGNTARRFFRNPQLSASITGIKEDLIRRFAVILTVLASGHDIKVQEFEEYAMATAQLYVEEYKWFYMPATVHKILLHGAEVVQHSCLPIGQLSEEAQEARNKDYKFYREHHTRKSSRTATNEDLLHLLLISSDPVISDKRPPPLKKSGVFMPEVLSLIKALDMTTADAASAAAAEDILSSEGSDSD